jgi:hypothetical protein
MPIGVKLPPMALVIDDDHDISHLCTRALERHRRGGPGKARTQAVATSRAITARRQSNDWLH